MLQREIFFEPRANKKLPAAASKRLLNDVAGIFRVLQMLVALSRSSPNWNYAFSVHAHYEFPSSFFFR